MDKVEKLLREFAGEIGTTVKELWPHAVNHYSLSAIQNIVGALIFWIISLCFFVFNKEKKYFIKDDGECPFTSKAAFLIILLIVTGILCGTVSSNLADAIEPTGGLLRQVFKL